MAVRIIVNADDLGISDSTNEAIFNAIERGAITSATILANGPSLLPAVKLLSHFSECSFGIHLNLTQFEPLLQTSRASLACILDDGGCFYGNTIREVRITPGMLAAIYREWCAQVERLIQLRVRPSHLDGHHHVHTLPEMLPVLTALRRRFKIGKARISKNVYSQEAPAKSLLVAKKRLYNFALKAVGFRTTELFTDLETFISTCAVRPPRASTIELMVHPGATGGREPELLQTGWRQHLCYPATLATYNSL